MDGAATETAVRAESRQVEVPDYVERQLRSRGLGNDELELDGIKDILENRRKAEKEASTVKTLDEAIAKAGIVDVRQKLQELNGPNPTDVKQAIEIIGGAKQIASRFDYIATTVQRAARFLTEQPKNNDEALYQRFGMELIRRAQANSPQSSPDDIGAMLQAQVAAMMPEIEAKLKYIQELSGQMLSGKTLDQLNQDVIKKLRDEIASIEAKEILGFKFLSPDPQVVDLNRATFEDYTVQRKDWYDEANTQNMENAIIEAAKFAGGDYAPNYENRLTGEKRAGGKFAMYTQYEDGSIKVHLENVNEYIIFRIAEHMNFQDPDDKIEVLGLRLFETSFRSITLYEFLIHDASKYAQTRTPEGVKPSVLYQDFLLYWALQASSSGHIYNSGIDVRNAAASEEAWQKTYEAICRSNKLASAKRLPRELRKLSRKDIEEQIARTGRLDYAEWKEFDGHLGQAISDYATLERYIFELSNGGWDVKKHLDSIDEEEAFDRRHRVKIIQIKKELGRLMGSGQKTVPPKTLTNLEIDDPQNPGRKKRATVGEISKILEDLESVRASIQNGEYTNKDGKKVPEQNYIFKVVHGGLANRADREKAIKEFLIDLTEKYMGLELGMDSDPKVREVMSRVKSAGGTFLSLIEGRSLPQGITEADRTIIINNLIVRAGFDRNGQNNLTEQKLKELAAGDFGVFAQRLFTLDGNQYKKNNLNIFTDYGGLAKEPLKGVVTSSLKGAVARKYGEKLTSYEMDYVYEAAKEVAEWSMRKAQNDTGVTGNEFPVRVAHPSDYFINNVSNLNVGDKETVNIIRNTQDMMIGVPISVEVTDNQTKESWKEMMWLGEFFERGMYTQQETRNKPEFGEQSLSVFFTRRVEAAYKMYKSQRDTKNGPSEVFNIGKYLVGYVLGDMEYNRGGIDAYKAQRNVLNDFLFTSKYPLPYKRNIREWVNEVGLDGKTQLTLKTMKTEEYLLGRNVFQLEKVVMSNPDIRERVEDGRWTRGQVLETMTELALIGSVLKQKVYYYLPHHEKELYESGTNGVISAFGLREAFYALTKTELGRFGAKRKLVQLPDGTFREDIVYQEGFRFTKQMAEQMFEIMSGMPLSQLDWYDFKQELNSSLFGFIFAFLSSLWSEMNKGLQGSLK